MLNINFITNNTDINRGSYRIWIKDIDDLIKKSKLANSKIITDVKDIDPDCDVIIIGKSFYKNANQVKNYFPSKKIGAINVDADYNNPAIDFVIVGSVEEYASLSFYKNVFVVDLIEQKFMNIPVKNHEEKETLTIGYHGHHPHLFKFFPFLKSAIEQASKEKKIKLKIIIGDKNFKWVHGKPDIEDVEILYYDQIDVSKEIKTFDIGVVPNVLDLRVFENFNDIAMTKNLEIGINTTDYFLRFKNKTNPGRAYVLYQHGIPVIHDMSPSSYAFMQETGLYSCAHDAHSWLKEIRNFYDHKTRQRYANVYHRAFSKKFCDEKRLESFLKHIKEIL